MAHAVELDDILKIAAQLFDARGYVETTMQEVADRLFISKPTLYKHAKSKSDVLQLIINRWIDQSDFYLEQAIALQDTAERIPALVRSWTELALINGDNLKIFLSDERDMPAKAKRRYHEWSKKVYRRFRQLVIDGQEAGFYRGDADPTITAFTFLGFILLLPRWLNENGRLTPQQVAEEFLKTFIGGLHYHVSTTEFENDVRTKVGGSRRRNSQERSLSG